MKRRDFLVGGLALAAAPLALSRFASAQTTSLGTGQYFLMATKGGDFLESSARLGFEKAADPRLRRFSRAEVIEQVRLADNLNANFTTASTTVPGGPLGNPASGALVGAGVGALVGGPVGAVVGAGVGATTGAAGAATGGEVAMTTDAQKAALLAQLESLSPGPDFDATFVQAQIQGHQEALVIHGTYAEQGDDPVIRRIAAGAVPLIRLHLSQLSRFQRG